MIPDVCLNSKYSNCEILFSFSFTPQLGCNCWDYMLFKAYHLFINIRSNFEWSKTHEKYRSNKNILHEIT